MQQMINGFLCSPAESCLSHLAPCSQEEADARLHLHLTDTVQKGCRKATIHTVDTDVVVMVVTTFSKIAPDKLLVQVKLSIHSYS